MTRTFCCALATCFAICVAPLASLHGEEFRTIDGVGNNPANFEWGATVIPFARRAPVDYEDGISVARIAGRPNPRSVGNALMRQSESRPNARKLSGYVYAFGNLISHDSQFSLAGNSEFLDFLIPPDDDIFPPGTNVRFTRTLDDPDSGTSVSNPRQQMNLTTAFIDASPVYGSDAPFASMLRGRSGAKLLTSNDINDDLENLLPREVLGPAPNASFVAGDPRVNDNIILTSMHTLFMREHNRLVDVLAADHPTWSTEQLYQRARKIVGAELQVITYNEFLPALLGPHAPASTGQYDPLLNPAVLNEFPAVFLRIGHSMLTNDFKRVLNNGQPAPGGSLPLEDAIFAPSKLTTSAELDLFLKGLSVEVQEETDLGLVNAMRGGLLDAIDIQRARDHGLPDYNTLREAYGLPRVTSFAEITSDVATQNAIAAVYPDINTIDPFVGALAEDHLPGASVGPLVAAGYRVQFDILRDGDRFWYENDAGFTLEEIAELRETRLSDIIRRNSAITNLQANVFFAVPEPTSWSICVVAALSVLCVTARIPPGGVARYGGSAQL